MIRMAYASLARSRISFCAAQRNAVAFVGGGEDAAGDLAAEDQGDNAAGHVLVDTGESDGLHVEAGFLADLAAQAVVDGLAEFEDAAGRFPAVVVARAGSAGHGRGRR